tara:strand:- start:281 stop:478 length:198 start_codon:yes stop_codon:yes gene_type:complete
MRTTERQLRDEDEEPTIDQMRRDIAEAEAMNMQTSDLMDLLLDGFVGLNETPAIEIKDEHRRLFS